MMNTHLDHESVLEDLEQEGVTLTRRPHGLLAVLQALDARPERYTCRSARVYRGSGSPGVIKGLKSGTGGIVQAWVAEGPSGPR